MGETAEKIIQAAQDECDRIIREANDAERSREIRAAVEAETARCATLTGWEVRAVSCNSPGCLAPPGEACRPDGQGRSHANRWRAAIRQTPEGGEGEDAS